MYDFNMTIWGQDEWGQFPPFVGEYEVLGTFNEVLNKKCFGF